MPLISTSDVLVMAGIALQLLWAWALKRQNDELRQELAAERNAGRQNEETWSQP